MLTNTRLRTAKTKELERLQARIEAELTARREEAQTAKPSEKEQLIYSVHTGSYQWEYVQCSHPERCRKCQTGEKHGPYLYRYF